MLKKYPKISIVTPSYNQEDFIEKTLISVLSQKYPNLEYIVIDGGSTDGTLEVLKRYKQNIILISEKDKGQTNALNKGFDIASGDILGFINSDDLYLPNSFSQITEFFDREKDINWATGLCSVIDENDRKIRNTVVKWKNLWLSIKLPQRWQFHLLLVLNFISQPATFWRRKAWTAIGPFDESLKYTMDYDYWLRLLNKFPLGVINNYLAAFRVHSSSKTKRYKKEQLNEGYKMVKLYTNSYALKTLHRLHDYITLYIYKDLL